jgi:Holliday junction resolvase RusA-like endonuclease
MYEEIVKKFDASKNKDVDEFQDFMAAESYSVNFTFYMPISETWTDKKKNLVSWGRVPHTAKPDVDNLVKFYLDVANGILWTDDAQVTIIKAKKVYAKKSGVEMEIQAMKPKTSKEVAEILQIVSVEEAIALKRKAEHLEESMQEGDINHCAKILEEIALKFTPKLQKICKIKQKYDKIEENFNRSELAIPAEDEEE